MEHQKTGTTGRTRGSAPLPDELRSMLAAMVNALGENAARERTGLSRGAFSRALGGLGIYPGTVALIRAALVKLHGQIPGSGTRP
jgi:hypothetical protein